LIGGHHEILASIVKACQRYETAVAEKGGPDSVRPADWQWNEDRCVSMLCHQHCLDARDMHVESPAIRDSRYRRNVEFPHSQVERALRRRRQNRQG